MQSTKKLLSCLSELETFYKTPVIAYFAPLKQGHLLIEDDVDIVMSALSRLPHKREVNFLLVSTGGQVTAAYKLWSRMRSYANSVKVLIPGPARSAATLFSLGAAEIRLGFNGELSPFDPIFEGTAGKGDAPGNISFKEIEHFLAMAQTNKELESHDLLAMLSQYIFPTTISALYRADHYTREIAREMLRVHLPGMSDKRRRLVLASLLSKYQCHNHTYSIEYLRTIGLRVACMGLEEGELCNRFVEEGSSVIGFHKSIGAKRSKCFAVVAARSCVYGYVATNISMDGNGRRVGGEVGWMAFN